MVVLATEVATPGVDWLGIFTLCGVIILACAGGIAFWFTIRRDQVEAGIRETLLYRLAQIEGRLKAVEESQRLFDHELQYLGERISRQRLTVDHVGGVEEESGLAMPLSGSSKASPERVSQATAREPALSPQVAEILQRHSKGQQVRQIAQEMNLGQGEVQLIISLMGTK